MSFVEGEKQLESCHKLGLTNTTILKITTLTKVIASNATVLF